MCVDPKSEVAPVVKHEVMELYVGHPDLFNLGTELGGDE
jgi:hypothetical protein